MRGEHDSWPDALFADVPAALEPAPFDLGEPQVLEWLLTALANTEL